MKDKKKEDSKCYGVKSREVLVPIPVCKMFQDIQNVSRYPNYLLKEVWEYWEDFISEAICMIMQILVFTGYQNLMQRF